MLHLTIVSFGEVVTCIACRTERDDEEIMTVHRERRGSDAPFVAEITHVTYEHRRALRRGLDEREGVRAGARGSGRRPGLLERPLAPEWFQRFGAELEEPLVIRTKGVDTIALDVDRSDHASIASRDGENRFRPGCTKRR
jgi:hypothetical protein